MRLRRDLRGFLGYGGYSALFFTLFFLLLVILLLRDPQPLNVPLAIFTAALGVAPISMLMGRVVIKDGFVVAGNRLFPQRRGLVDLVEAQAGLVIWSRGRVMGVRLFVNETDSIELRLSGELGEKRRELWIKELNAAIAAEKGDNTCLGAPRTQLETRTRPRCNACTNRAPTSSLPTQCHLGAHPCYEKSVRNT